MKKIHIITILAILILSISGCRAEQAFVNTSQEEDATKTIVISCAGDCTLGTDASFGGITLPVELKNQNNDYGYFFNNVREIFENDDLTIVNFEGTLTDRGARADKTFAFRGDPQYTKILMGGSVEAVTLANNHTLDYGEVGFEDTKKYLDEAGIIWFENLNTSVVNIKGVKVGLIGLYSLNGSAEGNLPKAMEQVKTDGAEIVIVQVHMGIEGESYPQASQISLAHKAIDLGADLVIGHHPHILQGIERYNGKMIAYSLGNFCFGGNQNPRDKDSMIFRQTFTVTENEGITDSSYQVIPCSISSVANRNNYQPTPVKAEEYERIKNKIQQISNKLGNEKINFAEEMQQ